MNDFFTKGEDFEIPSTSNYMRFEEGDNRFRILGSFSDNTAVRGTVYWKTVEGVRKPIRVTMGTIIDTGDIEINKFGEPDLPKHFWALPVYNYQEKKIQILEITQKTILNFIKKQAENPKWGDPRGYDIVVTREVDKGKTTYSVSNDPKETIDPGIKKTFQDMQINMQALFTGEDPFNSPSTTSASDFEKEMEESLAN